MSPSHQDPAPAEFGIWILIPVHNRRELTRACLDNLRSLGASAKYTVCVIDDASSDGTAEMLRADYPEVLVVAGDGNLYWGGGIAAGMRAAHSANAEVHVWLNDDCLPLPGAVEEVVSRVRYTKGICGAICYDPVQTGRITYSGARKGTPGVVAPEPGKHETVDVMNGNLVAVHASVIDRIGVVDAERFPHYGGDIEYCIRAKRLGIPTEISGSARALNRRDNPLTSFGVTKPAASVFHEPFRTASPIYWPAYWNILRLSYGWTAYLRWPTYFVRLLRIWFAAFRRSCRSSG